MPQKMPEAKFLDCLLSTPRGRIAAANLWRSLKFGPDGWCAMVGNLIKCAASLYEQGYEGEREPAAYNALRRAISNFMETETGQETLFSARIDADLDRHVSHVVHREIVLPANPHKAEEEGWLLIQRKKLDSIYYGSGEAAASPDPKEGLSDDLVEKLVRALETDPNPAAKLGDGSHNTVFLTWKGPEWQQAVAASPPGADARTVRDLLGLDREQGSFLVEIELGVTLRDLIAMPDRRVGVPTFLEAGKHRFFQQLDGRLDDVWGRAADLQRVRAGEYPFHGAPEVVLDQLPLARFCQKRARLIGQVSDEFPVDMDDRYARSLCRDGAGREVLPEKLIEDLLGCCPPMGKHPEGAT